jgi:ubiquinone/menaquinone biosynthesis C-methylase UbiE
MLGRLGGLVMARGNRAANSEITGLLAIRAGDQILEVGYGPGELMRHLADQSPATSITGVDPSPVMQDMARRRCAAAVAAGRVDPQLGSATHTGLPAASFDHVVSVNNVIFWGGIPAGLAELHRVLRPGGCLVAAWWLPFTAVPPLPASPARSACPRTRQCKSRTPCARCSAPPPVTSSGT